MNMQELKAVLRELELDYKMKVVSGSKGENLMFLCPYHGERNNPSAGILLSGDGSAYGQCFGCGERFSLEKLYADTKDIPYGQAVDELAEMFNVEKRKPERTTIPGYGRAAGRRRTREKFVLPDLTLAPFRSGKSTHSYFLDRGFTRETVKECRIGWDRVRKRVTIPIFHPDGTLLGIIGRAVVSDDKSAEYKALYGEEPKYYIYENFPVQQALFGSHEFPDGEEAALLVEGSLDRLWMRQIGCLNALAMLTSHLTRGGDQKRMLQKLGVKRVYFFHDNDKAGEEGKASTYAVLKDSFVCYDVTYPEGRKDPDGMTREEVERMIAEAVPYVPPAKKREERGKAFKKKRSSLYR